MWLANTPSPLSKESDLLYSARQLIINVLGDTRSYKSRTSLLCDKFVDIATSSNNDPARKTDPGTCLYIYAITQSRLEFEIGFALTPPKKFIWNVKDFLLVIL